MKTWLRENRPGTEEAFNREFNQVTSKLTAMSAHGPIGTIYDVSHGQIIRRVLLPRMQQHLYYSIDEATDTVIIRALWGARRGRGPKL